MRERERGEERERREERAYQKDGDAPAGKRRLDGSPRSID